MKSKNKVKMKFCERYIFRLNHEIECHCITKENMKCDKKKAYMCIHRFLLLYLPNIKPIIWNVKKS